MRAGKLVVAIMVTAMGSQSIAQAQTVSDYIEKQASLERLDHSIERYERLVKIKEAQEALNASGKSSQRSGNSKDGASGSGSVQYFTPSPQSGSATTPGAIDDAALAAKQRLSQEEREQKARDQQRLAELGLLNSAQILEVFRNDGPGSAYGAVLEIKGGRTEVQPGDTISHWKVTQVSLDQITLKNEKYDGVVRHIKQSR